MSQSERDPRESTVIDRYSFTAVRKRLPSIKLNQTQLNLLHGLPMLIIPIAIKPDSRSEIALFALLYFCFVFDSRSMLCAVVIGYLYINNDMESRQPIIFYWAHLSPWTTTTSSPVNESNAIFVLIAIIGRHLHNRRAKHKNLCYDVPLSIGTVVAAREMAKILNLPLASYSLISIRTYIYTRAWSQHISAISLYGRALRSV